MSKEKIFNIVVSYLFTFFFGISSYRFIQGTEGSFEYLLFNWIIDLFFTIFFIRFALKKE